ncbi:MAG: hypothetical protein MR355_10175 [Lachnospiraceae bacterium]|nr:hypothetical protein [Lachnospiraceae bacterium]
MATNNNNNGKKGFTLDESATKLLLVVGGLLLVFLAYQLGYRKFNAKIEDVNTQITALSEEINSLLVIQQDEEDYTLRTSTMKDEIDQMLADIEVQVPPQDRVMFAVAMESGTDEIEIKNVSAGPDVLLYTMNAAGTNPTDGGKALYNTVTSLTSHTTYAGLKDALQALLDSNDKVSISEASFARDKERGGITGSIAVNMFYLIGSDREYTPYPISGVPTGNENAFGEAANKMATMNVDESGEIVDAGDAEQDNETENEE